MSTVVKFPVVKHITNNNKKKPNITDVFLCNCAEVVYTYST